MVEWKQRGRWIFYRWFLLIWYTFKRLFSRFLFKLKSTFVSKHLNLYKPGRMVWMKSLTYWICGFSPDFLRHCILIKSLCFVKSIIARQLLWLTRQWFHITFYTDSFENWIGNREWVSPALERHTAGILVFNILYWVTIMQHSKNFLHQWKE